MLKCSIGSSRWATTSVAIVLVLLALIDPGRACAQPAAPAAERASTTDLARNGVPGVWMPNTTFRLITADLTAFHILRDQTLPDQARLLTLERAQGADLRAQLLSFEQSAATYETALTEIQTRHTRALDRLARVKRLRPWLFVAGVLVGTLVVIVPVALTR